MRTATAILHGYNCCLLKKEKRYCEICPYANESNCIGTLRNEVVDLIKETHDNTIKEVCRKMEEETNTKNGSAVEHPIHYQGHHECIDLMEALFGKEDVMAFCRCNSFKYRFRAGRKDGSPAEEDLKKAEFYEDLLIEMRQREGL